MNTVKLIVLCCICYAQLAHLPLRAQTAGKNNSGLWVQYPVIPLLKKQPGNALALIRLYAEAKPKVVLKFISVHLNEAAGLSFEKLTVYNNGNEPAFDTTVPGTTFIPKEGVHSIPVNISLKQGWNYIWISATLNEKAGLDSRPSAVVKNIVTSGNETWAVTQSAGNPEKRIGIAVRKPGEDNVHTYRIPGIIRTDKGTLVAVYDNRYHGSKDLPGDIDVGMSRSTDGGQTWEPMKVIVDMGEPHDNNGVGDPTVLFDPATRTIWVAAVWSKGNRAIGGSGPGLSPDSTAQLVLVSSSDDGLTWSAPHSITPQVKDPKWHMYFNGPGGGIVMQDGTLVFPSQYWDETTRPGIPHSAIIYSKDNGKTWHSGTGARYNTTESQVVETTPGTLMLNMRDNRGYYRSVATSSDFGKTWQEHSTSYHALPDPICMASLIKTPVMMKGKRQEVLFFSNVNMSSREHNRKNMTIKASLDLGETWLPQNELLLDERYGFGYSCLTRVDEHTLGILFEGIGDIIFMRVPVKDIIK